MYQNMDCLISGFNIFTYAVSYNIYNSSGEIIDNPVFLEVGLRKAGVCVPYGGYIYIEMDNNHSISVRVINSNTGSFLTIGPGESTKFKVLRDYTVTVSEVTTENNTVIEKQILP